MKGQVTLCVLVPRVVEESTDEVPKTAGLLNSGYRQLCLNEGASVQAYKARIHHCAKASKLTSSLHLPACRTPPPLRRPPPPPARR